MTEAANKGPKKIAVALSGGVDSAVSALLLKQQGHKIVGIFARGWNAPGSPCDWKQEALEAARVAAHLKIPFREIDSSDVYEKEVVVPMLESYKRGETPNPDIWCNRQIKFGFLANFAKEIGADFLATGHYARIKDSRLYRGLDKTKDQSYFLWTLKKEDLQRTIFPIGNLKKTEVRSLAKKFKLPNADKPDSQGICFVGELDLKDFLRKNLSPQGGPILSVSGEEIGRHDGAILYTTGERVGFEISDKEMKGLPLYVVETDAEKNIIVVSNSEPILKKGKIKLKLKNSSETYKESFKDAETCLIRYRGEPLKVISATTSEINISECPSFVTEGQSAVLYSKEDECLGGGEINKVEYSA